MKLVKPGLPQLPGKWWVGQVAVCDTCTAEVEFDATDKVRRYSGTMRMNCITPNCKGALSINIKDAKAERASGGDK